MLIKELKKALILLFFLPLALACGVLLYIRWFWPHAHYEQIINTMQDVTAEMIISQASVPMSFLCVLITLGLWLFLGFKLNKKQQITMSFLLILFISYFSGWLPYYIATNTTGQLYEKEYISPNTANIHFPKQKRNLILIYLESFEQNFSLEAYYQKNLIPNLVALHNDENHNLNYNKYIGTDYSIAALVSSECGVPLRFNLKRDIWEKQNFLPQAVCFPEILQKNGYQTKMMKAAEIKYSDTHLFATQHGYSEAIGIEEIEEKYPETSTPEHKGTFDGLNDRTLFEYAKKELAEFDLDKPFMLTLFSLDTHTPKFYQDKNCPVVFNDLRDAYMCTDSIVKEFIDWLQTSPYWQNTTVVIIGDHLLSTKIHLKGQPPRRLYNVFLNLPEGSKIDNKTPFSTLDFAPTILESLNITLPKHAFGLGRSLLSSAPTLSKTYGAALDLELMKKSEIYNRFLTPKEKHIEQYHPYTLSTEIKEKESINYTDTYEKVLNSYYLDSLYLELDHTPKHSLTLDIKFNALTDDKSHITFKANNQTLIEFRAQKSQTPPFSLSVKIPASDLTNNRLKLQFINDKGIFSAAGLGISPLSVIIREEETDD